jgi:large subunit ribosomal protein L10
MAINKQKKQDILIEYMNDINSSECIFLINTSGLSVNVIDEFRVKLRSLNNSKYKLIKNTLFKLALSKKELTEDILTNIYGYNAVVFSIKDSNLIAKEIVDFAESNGVEINFGLLNLNLLNKNEIKSLSQIPNKQTLIGSLIYVLNFNTNKVLNALNYNTKLLINSIDLVKDKKEVNV